MVKQNYNEIKLICIPYAGGSKFSYSIFQSFASKEIIVVPVELPGRGERVLEPLLFDINSMVDDLFIQMKDQFNRPYMIYGHSMGAILGYLVIKKIIAHKLPQPLHLIITGSEGPSIKEKRKKYRSRLSANEFIKELKILGGVPDEVLNDVSYLEFFEPILRSDFMAIENYLYVNDKKLNVPISVLFGSSEDFSIEEAFAWQNETNLKIEVIKLEGGHFFIFQHVKFIMDFIKKKIHQ